MYILNNKEKAALVTIVRRTRYDYLRKNHYTYLEDDIDMIDASFLVSEENIEKNYEEKYDRGLCASEIEKIFKNPYLVKSSKALTDREKLVLFLYYCEENEENDEKKTDEKIGQELNLKGNTISKIRYRALDKIRKEYFRLKGNDKNDF